MPPIVFLHGFLGSALDWEMVIRSRLLSAIAIDLPGHGKNSEEFDLFAHLKQLGPLHLVGYSMGGRLALKYKCENPHLVLSTTLISTHLGLKTEEEKGLRFVSDLSLAEEIRNTSIDEFLRRWYDQPLFRTLLLKMDICSMRRNQNREALANILLKYSLGFQPDYSFLVDDKTTLIVGEHDPKYQALYQNYHPTLISNSGHAIHLEEPDQLGMVLQEKFRC